MADIRIIPGSGLMQFTGSSNTVAYITSSDSVVQFTSSVKLSLVSENQIAASGSFVLTGSSAADSFVVAMDSIGGDREKFKINTQGVVVLGEPASTPSAVEGGIYYKDGIFHIGDDS